MTEGRLLPGPTRPTRPPGTPTQPRSSVPSRLDFISYPYEWTFGELRDAALLTLDVRARTRSTAGFTLKDASAYNVQFRGVRPTLIDHLSFERAAARRAVDRLPTSSASTSWPPWR